MLLKTIAKAQRIGECAFTGMLVNAIIFRSSVATAERQFGGKTLEPQTATSIR